MLADSDLADLCAACYANPDAFDKVFDPGGVWAGVKVYADATAIAFRGSNTIQDWFRDFQGLMMADEDLGDVEQGFWCGMRDLRDAVLSSIDRPVVITGHSLGAAHALLFGALFTILDYEPIKITVFGSPRPGGEKVKDILSPIPIHSYKNLDDPVTDVPFTVNPLFPYMHPRPLIPVSAEAMPDDQWGLLRHHHIQLYQKAMEQI